MLLFYHHLLLVQVLAVLVVLEVLEVSFVVLEERLFQVVVLLYKTLDIIEAYSILPESN